MMVSPDHINVLLSIIPLVNDKSTIEVTRIAAKVENKVTERTISFNYKGIAFIKSYRSFY